MRLFELAESKLSRRRGSERGGSARYIGAAAAGLRPPAGTIELAFKARLHASAGRKQYREGDDEGERGLSLFCRSPIEKLFLDRAYSKGLSEGKNPIELSSRGKKQCLNLTDRLSPPLFGPMGTSWLDRLKLSHLPNFQFFDEKFHVLVGRPALPRSPALSFA